MKLKYEITLLTLLILLLGALSLETPITWPPRFKNPLKLNLSGEPDELTKTSNSSSFFGTANSPIKLALPKDPDPRLPKNERVYAFAGSREALAFPDSKLPEEGIIETQIDGQPFILFVDKKMPWIVGFIPILGGKKLNLVKEGGVMRDTLSKSIFDPKTGQATDGPLKGQTLVSLPGRITTWDPWSTVYPETRVWPIDSLPPLSAEEVQKKIEEAASKQLNLPSNGNADELEELKKRASEKEPPPPEPPPPEPSPPEPPPPPEE